MLYKTPLAALLAIAAGIAIALYRAYPERLDRVFLIGPVIIYLGVSMLCNCNIGHRHVLPMIRTCWSGDWGASGATWRVPVRKWTALGAVWPFP